MRRRRRPCRPLNRRRSSEAARRLPKVSTPPVAPPSASGFSYRRPLPSPFLAPISFRLISKFKDKIPDWSVLMFLLQWNNTFCLLFCCSSKFHFIRSKSVRRPKKGKCDFFRHRTTSFGGIKQQKLGKTR